MNPARIPTQAENAWAVNDARRYAAVQATRFDLSARPPITTFAEPVKHLQVAPQPEPMLAATWRDNLIFAACSIAGLAVWAAAGYATWWLAGVVAAAHGVK